MILLAIETATELVGVAVADDSGPRAAVWATGRRRHTESLSPAIVHVCEQAGVGLGDLDAVVVDTGPGLFTGLRVGVATAKALAQGLGRPIVALSSLEVLAHGAYDAGVTGQVLSVVDARRGEVFVGPYGPPDRTGRPVALHPPDLLTPEVLADRLALDGPPVLVVGDGARRYAERWAGLARVTVAGPSLAGPPPASLAALGAGHLAAGGRAVPPADVHPVYLRDADARINWVTRQPPEPRS